MTKNGNPLLLTNQLSIGYERNTLLTGLNLALHAGQFICFMGINGIGKSSLIRSLAGLQPALSGEILYSGQPGDHDLPKKLAVVLTDKIAAQAMTVYELIAFGRYPYIGWDVKLSDLDKQLIETSIEQVNIGHLRERRFHELSDGQQQLVLIARALAQDSKIILLDEPTAHLDLNNKIEIMNLLRHVCRSSNKGIIIATHELDLALQTADLVWLAGKEKNIITGVPEDLVLNGTFDNVFQFNSYNLRTGMVEHTPYLNRTVTITGNGPVWHWTKRALERAGYHISDESNCHIITTESEQTFWIIRTPSGEQRTSTLHGLLTILSQL